MLKMSRILLISDPSYVPISLVFRKVFILPHAERPGDSLLRIELPAAKVVFEGAVVGLLPRLVEIARRQLTA